MSSNETHWTVEIRRVGRRRFSLRAKFYDVPAPGEYARDPYMADDFAIGSERHARRKAARIARRLERHRRESELLLYSDPVAVVAAPFGGAE